MGRGFLDSTVAGGELRPTKDVSAADDDGDLRPLLAGLNDLTGNLADFFHRDAPFATMSKTLARKLEQHAAIRANTILCGLVGHNNSVYLPEGQSATRELSGTDLPVKKLQQIQS